MTYKIKISKPGYNVLTETDPNNLIFSSDYNTLKYFASGSASVSVGSGSYTHTQEEVIYTHNLGYYPVFFVFAEINGDGLYHPLPLSFADAGIAIHDFIYTTTTQIIYRSETASIYGATTSYDIDLYYKIFKNNNLGL